MKRFVYALLLVAAAFALRAFAQETQADAKPKADAPVIISAEAMALVEVKRLRARVAELEAEKAAIEAKKNGESAQAEANNEMLKLLERHDISRDRLAEYEFTNAPDGALIVKKKAPVPNVAKAEGAKK